MTLEELRERVKEEIILHEGDVADWEWQKKGLTTEATQLGLSADAFARLVHQVSYSVQPDFGRILDLKERVIELATSQQNQLSPQDIRRLTEEGERMQMSRAFMTEKWIPDILADLPQSAPVPAITPPAPATVATPVATPVTPVSTSESTEKVRRKIKEILDDYDRHIPAQNLRFLFKAIDYDEQGLAREILAYLSEHFYASVKPPKGASLKEKLLSTDWRHLSWWEKETNESEAAPKPSLPSGPVLQDFKAVPSEIRQGETVRLHWKVANATAVTIVGVGQNLPPEGSRMVVPNKSNTYTLNDANGNRLGVAAVEVSHSRLRDWSGFWGILLAILMLALTIWVIYYEPESEQPVKKSQKTEEVQKQTPTEKKATKKKRPTKKSKPKKEETEDEAFREEDIPASEEV